ncbi:sperm acrosome membrane-associated protein 1 [Nothoprocta perdicaria]|uniref:sperm acrosome membrane-associated protein 1 n=1 Tax=Nothoprocta perdicaria TaxID=30464 RepID=UPI000E1BD9FA|nr:sperm acrosome membrane-associated protein 1 [Nothoprocta perdicaria]
MASFLLRAVVNSGWNDTVPREVESGECTVTCGIGIREVLLTRGCPGTEKKCVVRVEECRGQVDCGWGEPVSDSSGSVKMPCIFIPPENRFKYVWKILTPDQPAVILPNDSAILEVRRDTRPVTFQCDTQERGIAIASIKYTVYTTPGQEKRSPRKTRAYIVLIFSLVTGIVVVIGVIFVLIFIILHRASLKNIWESKLGKDSKDKQVAKKDSPRKMEETARSSESGSTLKGTSAPGASATATALPPSETKSAQEVAQPSPTENAVEEPTQDLQDEES